MNLKRVRRLNDFEVKSGPIVYWMSREQRVDDNWSLIFANELSNKYSTPLIVVFNIVPEFLGATLRQYSFMIDGLKVVEQKLSDLNIQFKLLVGNPIKNLLHFINETNAGALVTDFDPLKIKKEWKKDILRNIDFAFFEVDSHNLVPCWIASEKQEFAAYTFRQKVSKLMDEFMDEYPKLNVGNNIVNNETNWEDVFRKIKVIKRVKPVDWIKAGEIEANLAMDRFLREKLQFYHLQNNDPNKDNVSNLSPYLHFGQISAQRIISEVHACYTLKEAKEAFIEELFVRKELSDNYCHYCEDYDNSNGFPDWAKKTLAEHISDKREYIYSPEEFELAKTHDDLWNAAQKQMVKSGKMHGYMRMYWAKKILEWSESAESAMQIAIYLNDKYELDGRDPNGYTGIAWSIGGVHDRAWGERYIFGKVRYMNYNGCKSKFDVKEYINKWI
jgi:deoxyribodipyrimidine photo-lyase